MGKSSRRGLGAVTQVFSQARIPVRSGYDIALIGEGFFRERDPLTNEVLHSGRQFYFRLGWPNGYAGRLHTWVGHGSEGNRPADLHRYGHVGFLQRKSKVTTSATYVSNLDADCHLKL
jgi:hypothetical protein